MSFLPKIKRRKAYVGEIGHSGYRKYKKEISDDCAHRCVYCDLHANYVGGYDAMELDHFRPKAKKHFPHLCDDPFNLLFSCRSCNGKKRDDWPAGTGTDTHSNGIGYIDPFEDRSLYFRVDQEGCFVAEKPPSQYVVERLALNRPLAVAVRKKVITVTSLLEAAKRLKQAHDSHLDQSAGVDRDKLKELTTMMVKVSESLAAHVIATGPSL